MGAVGLAGQVCVCEGSLIMGIFDCISFFFGTEKEEYTRYTFLLLSEEDRINICLIVKGVSRVNQSHLTTALLLRGQNDQNMLQTLLEILRCDSHYIYRQPFV